jgi:hypothetical protein
MLFSTASTLRRIGLVILIGCMPIAKASAETIETKYQYAAKAVCSLLLTFGDGVLAQGTYRTLINIGNPTNEIVKFAFKPSVSGSLGEPSGGIGGVVAKKGELAPHASLSIDCGTIAGFFCPTADGLCIDFAVLEGFVRISSPVELDVVAIYTARPTEAEVSTMDVETVQPRAIAERVEVVSDHKLPTVRPRMMLRGTHEAE